MVTLTERTIMKSRSGVYSDTAENRRKHRVGQKYGAEKQPEDDEKTEKKETDPAKELEAVNKVIAAINEGKLNLPAAEVMKLSEKKQKLEAAKKQAEKINAGVKANEEKINEAQIQKIDSKKEEEKTEDGEYITHDKDKIKRYHLFRALKNARKTGAGASDSLKELGYLASSGINSKGKKKYAELFEEFGNKEYIYIDNSRKSEKKEEPKKEETEESYTRVKFEDVPNSGKVNLKKYLSEKVRKGVDEKWSNIKNIPTENLKKMEKGLVNDLNKNFEAIKKSQRAELLYSIMKVKGELESRGKENKGEQSSPKLYSGGKISGTKNEYFKNLNDVLNSENADSIVIPEHKLQGWHDTEDALAGTNWKVSREVDKNGNYELGGKYYIFHKKK